MNTNVILIVMGLVVLIINCATMLLTFPRKRSVPFTIGALALFTAAFYAVLYFMGVIVPEGVGLPGLAYLPIMVLLFEGQLFQKVFAYFLQFLLTAFQVALAQTVSGVFIQHGERVMFTIFIVILFSLFAVYITLVFKFGRRFFEMLFEYGRTTEWVFYSVGAAFSFTVLTVSRIAPGSTGHIVLLLFFILWSFGILCFAIISTHERSKQRYEVEFARDVISSGRDHYQKMNDMYDELRFLHHDYKYHLNAIGELLNSGNENEAEKYLADIQNQLSKKEFPYYCSNPVINALLASYAERCAKLDIKYDVQISIPVAMSVPNYDMCIVLGNLLENAVHAAENKNAERKIETVLNTQGAHLAVMVKNSFSGEMMQDGEHIVSAKTDGGLGLRSVQAVAARYGGELMTEWDNTTFSAFVLMKL